MKNYSRFAGHCVSAVVVLALMLLSAGFPGRVSAGQVASRNIKLSSSTPGATSVQYAVNFTTVGAANEIIVDFCSDSPLPGATCAFSSSTVPTVTGVTSSPGTAATVGSGSPLHTVKVTGLSLSAATNYTITLSGLTNPSTATTFFARILTYTTGNATGYVPANTTGGATTMGTTVDTGGVALSTAAAITLTARVMETLSFCVYLSSCGDTPSLTLGSGSPVALGTTLSTGNILTSISTNALSGVSVAMRNSNGCGGLSRDGGTTCDLAAVGATAATIGTGAGKFGMYMANSTGGTGATVSAVAPYSTSGSYGMDNTTAGNNVTATFGDQIATSSGASNAMINTLTFAAAASNTTPAGIYTATMQLIATGTF